VISRAKNETVKRNACSVDYGKKEIFNEPIVSIRLVRRIDDDLDAINGRRDQLEGKIQERYGLAKDKVRKEIDDWYSSQLW
jgi:hypothetical protein